MTGAPLGAYPCLASPLHSRLLSDVSAVISGSQWMWPSHRGATVLEMLALEETGQDFNLGILIPPCLSASSSPELCL